MTAVAASTTVAHDTELIAALREANLALYNAQRRAQAVIALLDKIGFADAVARKIESSDYDLVYAVDSILAQLRDDAEIQGDNIDLVLDRVDAAQEAAQ